MANKIEKQISEIHKSDMYGVFVELGVGHPLAQLLYEVPGASQTVEYSISPYSKEMQEQMFHLKGRSVSKEGVNTILNEIKTSKKTNTIFVSSFQLGEKGKSITHGWVGLEYNGKRMFYHLTLNPGHEFSSSRKVKIEALGYVCLNILGAKNDLSRLEKIHQDGMIDIIMDSEDNTLNYLETLLKTQMKLKEEDNSDCLIYVTSKGNVERVENLFRENPILNVYKGSFNPIHIFHDLFAQEITDITGVKTVLALSLNPLFKTINYQEVLDRVKMLNEHGYDVLITNKGEFHFDRQTIENRDVCKSIKQVNFLVGADTLNRILDTTFKLRKPDVLPDFWRIMYPDTTFYYVKREGYELNPVLLNVHNLIEVPELIHNVSSTEIRKLREEGKDFTHLLPKKK